MNVRFKYLIFVCCGNLFEFNDFCQTIGDGEYIYRSSYLKRDHLFVYINDPLKMRGTKPSGLYFYGSYENQDYESIYEEFKIRTRSEIGIDDFIKKQDLNKYKV